MSASLLLFPVLEVTHVLAGDDVVDVAVAVVLLLLQLLLVLLLLELVGDVTTTAAVVDGDAVSLDVDETNGSSLSS